MSPENGQSQSLTDRLWQARQRVLLRQMAAAALAVVTGAIILLLLLALLNRWNAWQEGSAFLAVLVCALAAGGAIGAFAWRFFLRPPALAELAVRIEKRHPEWMDSLICSVEREQAEEAERRPLERSLIEKTRRETAGLDFESLLMPRSCRPRFLAAGGAALLVLAPFFLFSGLAQKAFHHFSDALSGEPSGLVVEPGTAEVPRGQDVQISAEILRWEPEATIEYIDHSGRRVYPMHARDDEHRFTFYHVEDDIRYRIATPSLLSDWFELTVYTPPDIDEYELRITPPSYTDLPEETFSEIAGLETIEGSLAEMNLELPDGVSAWLRVAETEEDIPLENAEGSSTHTLERTLRQTKNVRFVLRDAEGREARTPVAEWRVRRDRPPEVDITRPAQDMPAPPDASIDIAALTSDDFGLTEISLEYSVSGQRRESRRLFRPSEDADRVTERNVQATLDLDELEVEDGDVVTYFVSAKDNREPEAQTGRSEVYFLEIREDSEPEEMEGAPEELDDFDIQALIVELKRIIRQSWQGLSHDDELRRRTGREVASALENLQHEIGDLQRDAIAQLGEETAEPLVELLDHTIQTLGTGATLAEQDVLDASIPFQERALADLVRIQNELMQDPATSDEPAEEGDPSQQPSPGDQTQDDLAEQLEQLLSDTRRLADDQAGQNRDLRRLSERETTEAQRSELQERQEGLQSEAERIRRELAAMQQAQGAQANLAGAGETMDQASGRINEDALDRAERAGERARSQILAAIDNLEESVQQATDSQLSQLAAQARELAGEQAEAAGASRQMGAEESVSNEEAAAARDTQREIQERLADLLRQVDDSSRDLRETHPEASSALAETGRELRSQDVDGQMGRAGNALLYRQFDRAADTQDEVSGHLGEFAESLGEAADAVPSLSREQLQELLSDVQRSHQEVMDMTGQSPEDIGEQLAEIQSRIGEGLDRAGRSAPDSPLQEIGGEMMASAQDAETRPNIFRVEGMLRSAGRALEEQILSLEMERQARLQRQTSEPPEKYRTLVEEYFRSLSEDE